MRMNHPVYWSEEQLLAACRISFSRASGPGGQNRNKVETSVLIEHVPTGLIGQASERRNQIENRKVALHRLRLQLALQHPSVHPSEIEDDSPKSDDRSVTGRYCRAGRMDISESNWDFPIVLFESVEMLIRTSWNVSEVAEEISVSSSQLIKLLKKYPPAFVRLNQAREALGLLKLK